MVVQVVAEKVAAQLAVQELLAKVITVVQALHQELLF
jgi:hypothetical protein